MHGFALVLAVTLTILSGFAPPAVASVRLLTDEALAATSVAAVHGRVAAVESRRDPATGAIHTYVTLDLVESWGASLPARVVLKQLGGRVGEVALVVGGAPRFELGEEVLAFLEVRGDGALTVAGLEQGKWHVSAEPTGAGRIAAERAVDDRTGRVKERRALDDLRRLAAAAGGPASRPGRPFVAVPQELALPAAAPPAEADGGVGVGAAGEWAYVIPSTPARWHQADTATPVPLDPQSGGHPVIAGGGLTQLTRAGALWGNASAIVLPPGVSRSARCFDNSDAADGRISVTYTDPCEEIGDQSSTLAIGGFYWYGGQRRTVNGVTFEGIGKGMVVTDDTTAKFTTLSLGCYEQLLAHEIGHAIGFGHSSDTAATMYPSITGCGGRTTSRPLGTSEMNALAATYPVSAPGAPQDVQASVQGTTITVQWGAAAGRVSSYVVEGAPAGQPAQAFDVGTATSWATAAPAGSYVFRVRARNAAGYGPYSPDVVAVVGAAPPPASVGAPRSLMSAVSGANVSFTWQPPATGQAQWYQFEAGSAPGLANVAVVPTGATGLSAAGVPAGTYYVRVRAVDTFGPGPATADIAVTVAALAVPGAPTGLSAVVSGRTVQLGWTPPPGGAVTYVLEAGSAPGLANLAVAPTAVPGLTATDVPVGVYYVRVRAVSTAGAGPASAEIVVTVR